MKIFKTSIYNPIIEDNKMGVYKITVPCNNKIYIGSSTNVKSRVSNHLSNSNLFKGDVLYEDICKCGEFGLDLVMECEEKELDFYESYFIKLFDSTNPSVGYNKIPIPIQRNKNYYFNRNSTIILFDKDHKFLKRFKNTSEACQELKIVYFTLKKACKSKTALKSGEFVSFL